MLTLDYAASLAQHEQGFSAFLAQATQQQALSVVGLHASLVMDQFDSAHQQVMIKLINSLLRENIMQLRSNLLILPSNTLERKTWRIEALKCFSSGEIISMEQVISAEQAQPISCIELISPLTDLFDSEKLKEFGRDLQQTWFNTALALAYRLLWGQELTPNKQNFWHYISQLGTSSSYALLEQWAAVGHPSHPTDRSKPGLNLTQILAYSPDFNAQVKLILGALKTDHLSADSMVKGEAITWGEIRLYWQKYFPQQMQAWQQQLEKQELNEQDYLPIPVHPWQAKHSLPHLFYDELQQQTLVLFEQITITTLPALSFRSMLPLIDKAPCLKVPVAIKMTSAKRLLSTRSAHMGPRFSRLMKQLLQKLPQVAEHFSLQAEEIGLHYQSPNKSDDKIASHLSYICRQNVCNSAEADEIMIPAASLLAPDPQGQPLWLSILQHQGSSDWPAAMALLAQYSNVLCQGPLAFYLHTGIGLEVHQQNTVLVCDQQGKIKRSLTRDFGAFRIYLPQFYMMDLPLEFHHDNRLQTEDPAQARNRLVHAMFISQLGEFIKSLTCHYQHDEAQAWQVVKTAVNNTASTLANQLDNHWLTQEINAFLNDPWPMKALMRMRLQASDDYLYFSIDNPLAKV
ncbi:MAG: siderophore synthetase component [Gammaproteobacteria bacterium]|jgi:siderophore synthetase component